MQNETYKTQFIPFLKLTNSEHLFLNIFLAHSSKEEN